MVQLYVPGTRVEIVGNEQKAPLDIGVVETSTPKNGQEHARMRIRSEVACPGRTYEFLDDERHFGWRPSSKNARPSELPFNSRRVYSIKPPRESTNKSTTAFSRTKSA